MIVKKNLAEKEGSMLPETQVQINAHVALCYMFLETAYTIQTEVSVEC